MEASEPTPDVPAQCIMHQKGTIYTNLMKNLELGEVDDQQESFVKRAVHILLDRWYFKH